MTRNILKGEIIVLLLGYVIWIERMATIKTQDLELSLTYSSNITISRCFILVCTISWYLGEYLFFNLKYLSHFGQKYIIMGILITRINILSNKYLPPE